MTIADVSKLITPEFAYLLTRWLKAITEPDQEEEEAEVVEPAAKWEPGPPEPAAEWVTNHSDHATDEAAT